MNKITIAIVLVGVLLAGGAGLWLTRPLQNAETITIGYIGPLTGPSAVLGMDAAEALRIAVEEVNADGGIHGTPLRLVIEDDQYLTRNTINAYEKLTQIDDAKIVLIASYGGVLAVGDRAKQDGVIVIDPLDCNADLADADNNIFCLATETESIGHVLADEAIAGGHMRAGIMYSTKDSFMSLVARSFRDRYVEQGGVYLEEPFSYDETDFRTHLAKMQEFGPTALVLLGHDETGLIMKQSRSLGIRAPFFTTGTITSPSAQEAAAGAAEGTVFAFWEGSPDNMDAVSFVETFTTKVGRGPILPLTTHPAYDTIGVIATKVLPTISTNMSDDTLRRALLAVRDYQGITGTISMDTDGGARIKESAYQLKDGKPVRIR